MSDRNHFVASDPSDSFASYTGTEPPADSGRGLREGLPPAFRMRADAHYVEQLDGAAPAVIVQYIAVHMIDVSDAPGDALPGLVESIKRNGVLEPLVVQRNNGTYRTITGQKRLAAARAAGLGDVPCLVHHVSDERAQALRDLLVHKPAPAPLSVDQARPASAGSAQDGKGLFGIAMAAMRLVADAPDGQFSLVKTAAGARLSIDLPPDT